MPFTLTPAQKDAAMTPEATITSHRRHRGRAAFTCAAALLATAGATLMCVAPATALTPGRHYEQVTPVDKAGETVAPTGISADGRRVVMNAGGSNGLPGFPAFYGLYNTLLAARGDTAWQAVPLIAPATTQANSKPFDVSSDATTLLSMQNTYEENASDAFQIVTMQAGGPPVSLSGVQRYEQPASTFLIPRFSGSTPDFSHVLLMTAGALTLRPQDPDGGSGTLYDLSRSPSGEVVLNNVGAGIQNPDPAEPTCRDIQLGSASRGDRALSDDGQTIFYSARPECGVAHLYARLRAQTTVEVSASECARQADAGASPPVLACSTTTSRAEYANASTDGRRVFFTSDAQLTDSDVDETTDLYEYDFTRPAGHRLLQVSAGGDGDATPGADAMVGGLLTSSDDGSRVYFAAQDVLTTQPNGQGEMATAGANNLYRWDAAGNRTTFVTTLDPIDQPWVFGQRSALMMGNDDEYLLFTSSARLTADDTDTAVDVYRYDATSNTLRRISTGQDGYDGNGNNNAFGAAINGRDRTVPAQQSTLQRSASKDGSRIIFSTAQALQPQDVNGMTDIYEWHDGHVDLISDGRDPASLTPYVADMFISADGSTVIFVSSRKLVAGDTDTAADVYAARLGDDFPPAPAPPAPPCVGDVCQGKPTAQAPPVSAATVTFGGAGNAVVSRRPTKRSVTVTTPKAITGTRTVLTVKAPAAGALTLSGAGLRSVRRAASAGTYRLAVRLDAAGLRALKKQHRYTTTARVVFTPAAGTSSTARVKLTFKAPATAKGR
jgi:WD40-like Beta Propeller Repeat